MAYIPKTQIEPLQKFTREYVSDNGTISIWYYDKGVHGKNPYKVEHKYTKEFLDSLKEKKKKVVKKK
jgi:hypothetical protein